MCPDDFLEISCLLDGKLVVKSIDFKGILGEGRHPTTLRCVYLLIKLLEGVHPGKFKGWNPKNGGLVQMIFLFGIGCFLGSSRPFSGGFQFTNA